MVGEGPHERVLGYGQCMGIMVFGTKILGKEIIFIFWADNYKVAWTHHMSHFGE